MNSSTGSPTTVEYSPTIWSLSNRNATGVTPADCAISTAEDSSTPPLKGTVTRVTSGVFTADVAS